MVRGELAPARSLSGRTDVHQGGGYDGQCPSLAVADVQDLGDVDELGEYCVSRSQAGRSEPEGLCQPPLLILQGRYQIAAPLPPCIGGHLFVYYIELLIFTNC